MARVTLHHLRGRLKHRVGDLGHRQLLVVGLLRGHDGCIGRQHKVNARVGHQIGLELIQVDVEGAVEAQRRRQRGDDLGNQAVQVGIAGFLNVQLAAADVIDGLIVEHERNIGVLQQRVRGQHRVVRLHDSCRHLGRRVHGEGQLGLLAVVNRQALQQQGAQARAGATTDGVEHQEALQASALVCQLTDAVEGQVNNLLANGVVATGKVVGSILLARDQLLGVEQLA
eukprot:366399-Chlamydomonas_euryale.AAC.58